MIPVPDLLFPDPHHALDGEALNQLLELAYMGGESGTSLEKVLSEPKSSFCVTLSGKICASK
jgi:hypothetical protein